MGIRARNSSDRLRTNWTPDMDRYFIDLMLEQVHKGNRIDDHLFSKRAWKHMTVSFNAKFGFQYEKDILKNRHKTLRNLYRAIKNLLDQSGFSWDETRQMVTADNFVWDDYIKAHSDARSYRIKTVPYYADLCVIYGKETIEGRDTHSSIDANTSVDAQGIKIDVLLDCPKSPTKPVDHRDPVEKVQESSSHSGGDIHEFDQQSMQLPVLPSTTQSRSTSEGSLDAFDETTTSTVTLADKKEENHESFSSENVILTLQAVPDIVDTPTSNRSRTYWQPPMDRYFIDIMLDQVHKGNQIDGLFRKQVWTDMTKLFNAKFEFKYDMDVLKNRYKTLRRQYGVIKTLLEQSGFFWNETRQMVTADDYVWQDYIKAHPDARQYMTRPVPYYNDLCVICRDVNVDGRDSRLGHDMEQHGEVSKLKACVVSGGMQSPGTSVFHRDGGDDMQEESSHLNGNIDLSDQKNKRQIETPLTSQHSKKVRSNGNEGMVNALHEMTTAVSSLGDKKKELASSIPIEDVIDAVQAIQDIDEDLLLDSCDFLEDEKMAKTFMALDVKLRKKWLIRKLRPL